MRKRSLRLFGSSVCSLALCAYSLASRGAEPNLPAAYPAEWGVIFEDAGPLKVAPIAPDDGHADGFGVNGFGGAARWSRHLEFNPSVVTYKKGTQLYTGGPSLRADIVFERDVAIPMRDGKKLYADVFRPAGVTTKLPVIVVYGPYGKSVPTNPRWVYPNTLGQTLTSYVSGLTRFESPDPDYWCANGYAVVSVDPRGVNMSEGDIHVWGMVQAGDAYDAIEWAGKQSWSSGKVGLSGVSWLGIQQWYVAALKPPHLAAIAPWGAHQHDIYRQDVMTGGIPSYTFNRLIMKSLMGRNKFEAPYEMAVKYPLWHPYWQDKVAKLENVTVPIYSVGNLGMLGVDTDGYRAAASTQKWLVVQNEHQWLDMYLPARVVETRSFFDRYLKGIQNGWETTPKVRVPVIDVLITNGLGTTLTKKEAYTRQGTAWPLPQTQYDKYYLSADTATLSTSVPSASQLSYDALKGKATFTYTFDRDTELTGYVTLRLYVEADGADDMDLFVSVNKLDANDSVLYAATAGQQRASLRALDASLSKPYLPVHSFLKNEKLAAGQVVPVDIAINPTAILFHKGQKLSVTVGGNAVASPFVRPSNAGKHIIHTGSQYASYLQVPVIQ